MDYDPKVSLICCLSCIRPPPFLNPCLLLTSNLLNCLPSLPSVAHVYFCSPCAYIANLCFLCYIELRAKPKVHPDSSSLPKPGFGMYGEARSTDLPWQEELSWGPTTARGSAAAPTWRSSVCILLSGILEASLC